MHIPSYNKHPLAFGQDIYDGRDISKEIYCVIFLLYKQYKFSRYMTPNGWGKSAHYYQSKEEAEADFNKFGQSYPPQVETYEYEMRVDEVDYWRQ